MLNENVIKMELPCQETGIGAYPGAPETMWTLGMQFPMPTRLNWEKTISS